MDLIQEVLESTNTFEAPKRFYYWSTLATISAVLKDHVWFDMAGNYQLFPNIYVLLYGPSGIRKGPPIALAQELVTLVDNTRVIDGRSSIEAVIKELGTFTTREGRPTIKDSCGFMIASELSSSIVGNNSAMDIMTNLYDRQYNTTEWRYRLKVSESARLLKPTITWLSGTNEALFRDFMPEKNLNGGLIGRMFVISEHTKQQTNSLMFKTRAPDKNKLVSCLQEMTKIQGEFTMGDDVRQAIDGWYNEFDKKVAPGLNDDTGFVSRMLDFVIKVAMIIAVGRRGAKELNIDDVLEAIQVVKPLIVPTKKVVNSVKRTDNSLITKRAQVLTYLSSQPDYKSERGKLLQNLGLQIDHEDLDKIAQFMIQMNVLTIDSHGGRIEYRLRVDRPEVAEWLKNYKSKD